MGLGASKWLVNRLAGRPGSYLLNPTWAHTLPQAPTAGYGQVPTAIYGKALTAVYSKVLIAVYGKINGDHEKENGTAIYHHLSINGDRWPRFSNVIHNRTECSTDFKCY